MIEQIMFERVMFFIGAIWFILVVSLILCWEYFEEQKLYRKLLKLIDRFEKTKRRVKKK